MHLIITIVGSVLLLDTVRACDVGCVAPGGSCDPADDITCLCEPGYHGLNCGTDGTTSCGGGAACTTPEVCIDAGTCSSDCATVACQNSGTCVTTGLATGSVRVCKCLAANVGATCNLVCPTCLNGGTCVEAESAAACACPDTHTGDTCEQVCPTDCVAHYEECVAGVIPSTTATCDCVAGLSETNCTTITCSAGDPCINGGTCVTDTCTCDTTMYAGVLCELVCTAACTEGQTCQEEAGVGTCLGSGGSSLIASVILVLAVAARRLI